MEKKTFVKKELVEALQKKYPKVLSSNIEKMTDSIFRFLSNKLAAGHNVEIRGFGMMKVKTTSPRKARNPRTGQTVEVGIKRKISWKSSKLLNNEINYDIEKDTEWKKKYLLLVIPRIFQPLKKLSLIVKPQN